MAQPCHALFLDRRVADVNKLLERVDDICPFPAVAQRLMALTHDHRASVKAIADTLQTDPALAMQALRVANSAAFYRANGEPICDLRQAVVSIGLEALDSMAGAMALLASFATPDELSLDLHARSAVCGSIASSVMSVSRGERHYLPFISGLLCGIGTLACLAVDGPGYIDLRGQAAAQGVAGSIAFALACEDLESARYGIPSRAIGARLVRRHRLPEDVASAVGAEPLQSAEAPLLVRATVFARTAAPMVLSARDTPNPKLAADIEEAARSSALVEIETPELVRRCVGAVATAERSLRDARTAPARARPQSPSERSLQTRRIRS